jgi:subtilisin family serine protease
MFWIMLFAQKAPERELIVWLGNGLLEVTEQKDGEWLGRINSETVNAILSKYDVEAIVCPFPDYNPADTLRILPDGKPHSLVNLREVCHIRLISPAAVDSLLQDLSSLYEIRLIEKPIPSILHSTIPNDPLFSEQWGLRNTGQSGGQSGFDIKATEAWDYWQGSSNTIVAILEDGIVDRTHEELQGKVIGANAPSLYTWHSTAVASIVSAYTNNNKGIAGVDWHARLNIQDYGNGTVPELAQVIYEAVNAGAKIINCSWAFSWSFNQTVYDAFVYALQLNRLPVAAMPATYNAKPFPSAYGPWMVAVAGTDRYNQPATYTKERKWVDVAAPGGEDVEEEGIMSPYTTNSYSDYQGGTSFAAPHVSGLAGLLLAANTNLKNYDLEWIFKYCATDVDPSGYDDKTGYGLVKAYEAVRHVVLPYEIIAVSLVSRDVLFVSRDDNQ